LSKAKTTENILLQSAFSRQELTLVWTGQGDCTEKFWNGALQTAAGVYLG
jgi:hypothetical protein